MEECSTCEYKENCKLNLYVVNPCDCIITHTVPSFFEPTIWKYQNPFTGKYENKPIEPYYIKNPFMYEVK